MQKMNWAMFFLLLVVGWSSSGKADNTQQDTAKQAFQEGVAAFKTQRYEDAVKLFRKANELNPTWKLYYNIGQCEVLLKNYVSALEMFERYITKGGDEIPLSRQKEVIAEIQRIKRMTGVVQLSGQNGDLIVINGEIRGKLPEMERIKVVMGQVVLEVKRNDKVVLKRVFDVSSGETVSVAVSAAKEELPTPATPQTVAEETTQPSKTTAEPVFVPKEKQRVWTWVALGVGGAAAIGAGITGGLAAGKKGDLDDNCTEDAAGNKVECPTGTLDSAEALAVTTNVLIGVAAAAVATGAVLFFVEPKLGEEDRALAVVPAIGPAFAGAAVSGRF